MSSSNKQELELQDQASANKDKDLHSEENLLKETHPSKDQIRDADEELRKNLLFGQKDISIFRLLGHLSYRTEMILMFLGVIGSLGRCWNCKPYSRSIDWGHNLKVWRHPGER